MIIFRDCSIWYIDNFMKMPQSNRMYANGAAKRRKKEERINAHEERKGLLDRFVGVAQQVVLLSLQRRMQLQAPKLLIVAMSV